MLFFESRFHLKHLLIRFESSHVDDYNRWWASRNIIFTSLSVRQFRTYGLCWSSILVDYLYLHKEIPHEYLMTYISGWGIPSFPEISVSKYSYVIWAIQGAYTHTLTDPSHNWPSLLETLLQHVYGLPSMIYTTHSLLHSQSAQLE